MRADGAAGAATGVRGRRLMEDFVYQDGRLHAESVPLELIAEEHGTPCFVYSAASMQRRVEELHAAFSGQSCRTCYAVKANGNLAVLQHLARLGCAFDLVSGGELARVQAAGGDVAGSVFSGVGKTSEEIRLALDAGIGAFHVESPSELERISRIAREAGKVAPISLRVNPAIEVDTHPHIATGFRGSKFGIPWEEALETYRLANRLDGLEIRGVACHIGSQLVDPGPVVTAARQLVELADQLRTEGIELEYIDVGGGLGICYQREKPAPLQPYAEGLREAIGDRPLSLVIEPGRYVVGNAGILLTRVEYIKHTAGGNFVVVDAAMTELMRPALYGAWHAIMPVVKDEARERLHCDVVGPVCETGDFLAVQGALQCRKADCLQYSPVARTRLPWAVPTMPARPPPR